MRFGVAKGVNEVTNRNPHAPEKTHSNLLRNNDLGRSRDKKRQRRSSKKLGTIHYFAAKKREGLLF
jgi:hypothetical protein